jgi:hypothetical protein
LRFGFTEMGLGNRCDNLSWLELSLALRKKGEQFQSTPRVNLGFEGKRGQGVLRCKGFHSKRLKPDNTTTEILVKIKVRIFWSKNSSQLPSNHFSSAGTDCDRLQRAAALEAHRAGVLRHDGQQAEGGHRGRARETARGANTLPGSVFFVALETKRRLFHSGGQSKREVGSRFLNDEDRQDSAGRLAQVDSPEDCKILRQPEIFSCCRSHN